MRVVWVSIRKATKSWFVSQVKNVTQNVKSFTNYQSRWSDMLNQIRNVVKFWEDDHLFSYLHCWFVSLGPALPAVSAIMLVTVTDFKLKYLRWWIKRRTVNESAQHKCVLLKMRRVAVPPRAAFSNFLKVKHQESTLGVISYITHECKNSYNLSKTDMNLNWFLQEDLNIPESRR